MKEPFLCLSFHLLETAWRQTHINGANIYTTPVNITVCCGVCSVIRGCTQSTPGARESYMIDDEPKTTGQLNAGSSVWRGRRTPKTRTHARSSYANNRHAAPGQAWRVTPDACVRHGAFGVGGRETRIVSADNEDALVEVAHQRVHRRYESMRALKRTTPGTPYVLSANTSKVCTIARTRQQVVLEAAAAAERRKEPRAPKRLNLELFELVPNRA